MQARLWRAHAEDRSSIDLFTNCIDRTRVVLVHKDFWRLGEGGRGMAGAVGAADGWESGLQQFAEFAAK